MMSDARARRDLAAMQEIEFRRNRATIAAPTTAMSQAG